MKAFFLILSLLGPSLVQTSPSPFLNFDASIDPILNADIFDDFLEFDCFEPRLHATIPDSVSHDADDEMDQVSPPLLSTTEPVRPTTESKPRKKSRAKTKAAKRKHLSNLRLQRSEEKPNYRTPFHYRVECDCKHEMIFKYISPALEHLSIIHKIPKNSNVSGYIHLIDYQSHADDFPFLCPLCPYRSVCLANLRRHRTQCHDLDA